MCMHATNFVLSVAPRSGSTNRLACMIIWIQTDFDTDVIPERILEKKLFWKKSADNVNKKHEKLP